MTSFLAQRMRQAAGRADFAPPPDPGAIAARVARRRRRVTLVSAAASAVVAVGLITALGLGGSEPGSSGVDPVAGSSKAVVQPTNAAELELDCGPDGDREAATLDEVADGFAEPEAAVAGMVRTGERASVHMVDDATAQVALVRVDGTTRAVVTVTRDQSGWRAYTATGCAGEIFGRS